MKDSICCLHQEIQEKLMLVKSAILKSLEPDRIIIYGPNFVIEGESDGTASDLTHLDLVILTGVKGKLTDYEIQDLVEGRCRKIIEVNVLVLDSAYFNDRLAGGHHFFYMIQKLGIMLYESGSNPIRKVEKPKYEDVLRKADDDFKKWWTKGMSYFKIASYSNDQLELPIAAFLLHQATECVYEAVILTFWGFKPTTHNIAKLRRYSCSCSSRLADVFRPNSESEAKLFNLLQSAYVDARYKEYVISKTEVDSILEQVNELLKISSDVCKNKMREYERLGIKNSRG
jgi:HEPN domain-containing protein